MRVIPFVACAAVACATASSPARASAHSVAAAQQPPATQPAPATLQPPAPPPPPASPAQPMTASQPPTAQVGPVRQLTITDAVQTALEQNLGVQVERINPQISDETVASAQTAWIPTLQSNIYYNNAKSPPESFLSGSSTTLQSGQFFGDAALSKALRWGGSSVSVGWDGSRATTNNIFSNFNPRLRSNLTFNYTQPVLRNFKVDSARNQLIISRRNREIADVDLRGAVIQTTRNVKSAYWNLKAAIANLGVQQQSLDLARQTLKDNQTRVQVGTMAPIDIVEAESEVARNEENVIVAEATIRAAEDQLRTLVFNPQSPDFWTMTIEPVDAPQVPPVAVDADAAIRNALANRTDLVSARKSMQNVAQNLTFYRNQSLPQVNLTVDFNTTALGGLQFERTGGFPGSIIPGSEVDRGFGSVISDLFKSAYPTWQIGFVVSYPIGRNASEVNYTRTRLQQTQSELQIRNLELQVASQVRDTVRNVSTNAKRVDATRAARVLAERRLEAEQKKFGVGMSTSFLVFQAQRDLATARVAELSALLDYNKSLADFEAVQEAPLAGGGVSIGGSTTTSAATTTSASSGGTSGTNAGGGTQRQ